MKTKSLRQRRADSGKITGMGDGKETKSLEREGSGMELDDETELDEALRSIACGIRRMQAIDPPASFLPSVMEAVRSRKLPWWVRLSRWAGSRKSITYTPLQAASALGMICVVSVASILFGLRGNDLVGHRANIRDEISVVLTLKMPEAKSVSVIGSFNNWHAQGFEMKRGGNQTSWSLDLKLPAGRYEYAFVVDGGRIVPDPGAELFQDDGFGNRNAVMIVGNNGYENSI